MKSSCSRPFHHYGNLILQAYQDVQFTESKFLRLFSYREDIRTVSGYDQTAEFLRFPSISSHDADYKK